MSYLRRQVSNIVVSKMGSFSEKLTIATSIVVIIKVKVVDSILCICISIVSPIY